MFKQQNCSGSEQSFRSKGLPNPFKDKFCRDTKGELWELPGVGRIRWLELVGHWFQVDEETYSAGLYKTPDAKLSLVVS